MTDEIFKISYLQHTYEAETVELSKCEFMPQTLVY